MHLLQNAGHSLLRLLLFFHFSQLAARNCRLLVAFLELFVRQEVLCHDTGDLFEVIEDGKSRILLALIWRAELAELVVRV